MKRQVLTVRVLLYVLLGIVAVLFIAPIVLMTVSSFKSTNQIMLDMSGISAFLPVGDLSFDNFSYLFGQLSVGRYFLNSLITTGLAITIAIFFDSMMGYAIGVLKFKGQRIVLAVVISLLIIPTESIIINRMVVANSFNLIDTLPALILPFLSTPFYIFLFFQHFRSMPKDLVEAAILDGSGYFRIYWQIMLPLSKPVIATVAILAFVKRWSDLAWPMVVTRSDDIKVLPLALQSFYSDQGNDWGPLFSLGTLMTIPVLIVFFIFQRQFIASIAHSGGKG